MNENLTYIGLGYKAIEFYKVCCEEGIEEYKTFIKMAKKMPKNKDFRGSITFHFNPGKITIEKRDFEDV